MFKKYKRYYVTYQFCKSSFQGVGSMYTSVKGKITEETIKELSNWIKTDQKFDEVVITNIIKIKKGGASNVKQTRSKS